MNDETKQIPRWFAEGGGELLEKALADAERAEREFSTATRVNPADMRIPTTI